MSMNNQYLCVQPQVREALATKRAVVALESTIISHGMPYPENVQTARQVEQIVRNHGAVPATIAIADGRICIGLDDTQLEQLGRARGVHKVSRRDLASVLVSRQLGATTVAATMICAHLAGIGVFVTGGIGGVHRGASKTMDVSADLRELATTPVAVVCAGAKAVLDLPKTLEVLETEGVPVLGYQTDEFPAFYSRRSGLSVDMTVQDAPEVARIMKAKWELGLRGGLLVTVPVPEQDELAGAMLHACIEKALQEASEAGIQGKDVTPFLLKRIVEFTGGQSLATNVALVENNARVGAQIAVAYAELLAQAHT